MNVSLDNVIVTFGNTVGTRYNALLYSTDFDIARSGLGSMTGAYSIIAWATSTESAIFEASQENWDTFIYYVCLRGISVYNTGTPIQCCVRGPHHGAAM